MTDKTISIYWFFILFVVAFAIVFLTYSVYGKPLDVREMEGIFLAEKVADCISQGGKISTEVLKDSGEFLLSDETFLKTCHLNFDTEKIYGWNNDQFFVSVNFLISGEKEGRIFSSGNENLMMNSNINFIDSRDRNLPFCVNRTIYSNGADGKYYSIKLISCARKTEKNA